MQGKENTMFQHEQCNKYRVRLPLQNCVSGSNPVECTVGCQDSCLLGKVRKLPQRHSWLCFGKQLPSYMNFLKLFVTNRICSNKVGTHHPMTWSLKVALHSTCHVTDHEESSSKYTVSAFAQFGPLYWQIAKEGLKFIWHCALNSKNSTYTTHS